LAGSNAAQVFDGIHSVRVTWDAGHVTDNRYRRVLTFPLNRDLGDRYLGWRFRDPLPQGVMTLVSG